MAMKFNNKANRFEAGGDKSAAASAALLAITSKTNEAIVAMEALVKTCHVAENSVPNSLRGQASEITAHINFGIGQLRKGLMASGSLYNKVAYGGSK